MNINIESTPYGFSSLACPSCGEPTLHHGEVEVFIRTNEDSQTGRHIMVKQNGWVDTDDNISLNPSERRDGVLIHLSCEGCSNKSVLAIVQHKGETQLSTGIVQERINYAA